jgi:hypothetical protein
MSTQYSVGTNAHHAQATLRGQTIVFTKELPMKTSQFTLLSVAAMLSISLMVGCGDKTAEPPAQQSGSSSISESDHGHPHEGEAAHGGHGAGPHDGTLADWGGGEYHVEFTVDHDKKQATVYVLGSDEQTPAPITAETLLVTIKKP